MLVLKVILVILYFLIGFFFVGAVIKVGDDCFDGKEYVKVIGALLYLFFWPVLIAVGLGMKVIDSTK